MAAAAVNMEREQQLRQLADVENHPRDVAVDTRKDDEGGQRAPSGDGGGGGKTSKRTHPTVHPYNR